MKIDGAFGEELIRKAIKGGADRAEVFLKSLRNLSVEIKGQEVDSLKSSVSFGYSVRVFRDRRLGFSYSTSAEEDDVVISSALEASGHSDEDMYLDLPGASESAAVEVFDPAIDSLREDEAIGRVMLLERSVFAEDPRIKKVRKASGSFTSSETLIMNSNGLRAHYVSTSCASQIMAVAEEGGESQMGWDYQGSRFLSKVSFEEVGRMAARRAVRLLGSRRIGSERVSVIMESSVAVDFLGIFASLLSSEAVQKGKSMLSGRLNTRVISEKVNIVDSGLIPAGLGSGPVDDEGVPSGEKLLIREGELQTYLYNTYTAKKDGVVSTGNAARGGFSSLPSVGPSNLFIEASSKSGCVSAADIFNVVGRGLYVVDAMGVHTANPISGEFSVGVTGIWFENGKAMYPVKEAVISGNILELFGRIEALGDDLAFYGGTGSPSIVFRDVDISA